MKNVYLSFFALAFCLGSCAPKIVTQVTKSYPALDNLEEVTVLGLNEEIPANAEVLAEIKIGDSGLTVKCKFEDVINQAKLQTRKIGGNVLKLTSHRLPSVMGSSCHRIEGKILRYDLSDLTQLTNTTDSAVSEAALVKPQPVRKDFQKLVITLNGGYSHLIAKISKEVPDDFRQYTKELKSGYHIGGDLSYFFSELYGAGIRYNLFRTSNSVNNIYVTDQNNNTRYGMMKDDISVNYIAPSFVSRGINKKGNAELLMSLSLGYVNYQNNALLIDPVKITGSTLGGAFDFGYAVKLSKKLSLGLQASYFAGKLTKITYTRGATQEIRKLENDEAESLNRIDISAGLRLGL